MRVGLICDRWEHHSRHSGYEQLCRHLDADELPPGPFHKFLHRFPKNFGHAFPDIWEPWRIPYHSARELDVFMRSIWNGRRIYHFLYGENTVRILPYIKRRCCRIVCTFHQPEEMLEGAEQFHRTVSKLDGIVVLAGHQIPFYARYAEREKIFFVPYGVDTGNFSPGTEDGNPRRCLFVGNWLRCFETMVGIARRLRDARPHVGIDVVTLEKNFRYFENMPNVRCMAGISEDALVRLYRRSALLVMPLLAATANNALLEAMACGLPIVTNDTGGVRDYVDDSCSSILPERDAPAFTEEILRLLDDADKRASMAIAARKRALEYDWGKIALMMQQVYDKISGSS